MIGHAERMGTVGSIIRSSRCTKTKNGSRNAGINKNSYQIQYRLRLKEEISALEEKVAAAQRQLATARSRRAALTKTANNHRRRTHNAINQLLDISKPSLRHASSAPVLAQPLYSSDKAPLSSPSPRSHPTSNPLNRSISTSNLGSTATPTATRSTSGNTTFTHFPPQNSGQAFAMASVDAAAMLSFLPNTPKPLNTAVHHPHLTSASSADSLSTATCFLPGETPTTLCMPNCPLANHHTPPPLNPLLDAHNLITAMAVRAKEAHLRIATKAAHAGGTSMEEVCWDLVTPYTVSPTDKLSMSRAQTSTASEVSYYLYQMLNALERLFLSQILDESSDTLPWAVPSDPAAIHEQIVASIDDRLSRHAFHCSFACGACSPGGLFSIASGAPYAISRVCRRYAALLPRPTWLAVIQLFTNDLMPLRHAKCAEFARRLQQSMPRVGEVSEAISEESGGPASPDRAEADCPLCSAVPYVASCLRQLVMEAMQREEVTGPPVDATLIRDSAERRAAAVFAFGGGMITTLMRSCPGSYRLHYMCCKAVNWFSPDESDTVGDTADETADETVDLERSCAEELYRSLRLPPAQQSLAAAVWHVWCRHRRDLDQAFHAALRALSCAPSDPDAVRSDPSAPIRTFQALAATAELRALQTADSKLFIDVHRAVNIPGGVFTTAQMAALPRVSRPFKLNFVSWMLMCQIAHEDLRQKDLFGLIDDMSLHTGCLLC